MEAEGREGIREEDKSCPVIDGSHKRAGRNVAVPHG